MSVIMNAIANKIMGNQVSSTPASADQVLTASGSSASAWQYTNPAKMRIASQAAGDIIYADTTTTFARLAKATDGNVLTLASGVPSWAAPSGGPVDGWTPAGETWTYLSATTITVPTGAATRYDKGDKIKLTQSATVKYFYIVAVADTVLTISGDASGSPLTNNTITLNYYSHQANPIGFPDWFAFTPTYSVTSGTAPTYTGVNVGRYRINGKTCSYQFYSINSSGGTQGSSSAQLDIALPVAPDLSVTAGATVLGGAAFYYNGITETGLVTFVSTTSTLVCKLASTANLVGNDQNATVRQIMGNCDYKI